MMERQDTIEGSVVVLPNVTNVLHPATPVYSWDRQLNESTDDFTRFECYRMIPGRRSVRQAYIRYLVDTVGQAEVDRRASSEYGLKTTPSNWIDMSRRNHWVGRASAFDAHQHDLDMAVETEERDRCRQLRKDALHKSLTAGVNALAQVDLSQANLAQAAAIIKMAVRELRTEYHDDSAQVEVSAMLAIIPNDIRQGILAMLQVKATGPLTGPLALPPADHDNITDNNDT